MNFAFGDIPIIKRHVSTPFLCRLDRDEAAKFAQFETKFKKFLYCGVSVQHLKPNSAATRSGMTRREKRTLWLMLPEVGSLRLGFVSKIKDNGSDISMDDKTVASSVASSSADVNVRIVLRHNLRNSLLCPFLMLIFILLPQNTRTEAANVKLSGKYSVSLTDITTLSQDPNVSVLRVILNILN